MRIMYLVNALNTGGSEHQMVESARRLQKRGHEMTVGCLLAQGAYLPLIQSMYIPVVEFSPHGNLMGPGGISAILRLASYLRRNRIDVVHTHDLYSNLLGVPAAWLARTPRIISSRRDLASWWWYTPRNRKILRVIQNRSDVVVANSAAVRDWLVREDSFATEKIKIVRNGVDVDKFANVPVDRGHVFPQHSGKQLIIAVANMHVHTKGHSYLIEAAQQVCSQVDDAVFLLVGDGDLRRSFEADVARRGLDDHFVFMGARKDVPELLACCDIAVLSSIAEGLPNVVLEYMAAGLPVVATSVGGVPEIIENDRTGVIIPAKDSAAMATAITKILIDKPFASKIAKAGQGSVRERFSYDRLIDQLEDLYSGGGIRSASENRRNRDNRPVLTK